MIKKRTKKEGKKTRAEREGEWGEKTINKTAVLHRKGSSLTGVLLAAVAMRGDHLSHSRVYRT